MILCTTGVYSAQAKSKRSIATDRYEEISALKLSQMTNPPCQPTPMWAGEENCSTSRASYS